MLPCAALAQELPPPDGWPLRPVAALRAVPEPPGGLVPYRQGELWGFADTTGRVWIRPVFRFEPPCFGAGLLLQTEQASEPHQTTYQYRPLQPGTKLPRWLPSWNLRYGWLHAAEDYGPLIWNVSFRKPSKTGVSFVLNAHGEQLLVSAREAIASTAGGGWQAVARPARATGQHELAAIESSEIEPYWQRPGRLFTVPLGAQPPGVPARFMRRRAYDPEVDFEAPLPAGSPLYLAQKVNWLRPHRLVWHSRDGISRQLAGTRYRYHGRMALFDARGHRLTDYRYRGMKQLLPQRLAYWQYTDSLYYDREAADSAGLARNWLIGEGPDVMACRYGLLDRRGREITPPLFLRLEAAGPNSLWVVAVRQQRLHYGLIDTLGHYLLPLSPRPISLPDAAGLLRQLSQAPLPHGRFNNATKVRYPDSTTVQYLRPDGHPAFPGRFTRADAFWQGRALVQQGKQFGLLDSLGHWVLPPQREMLRYYRYAKAHHNQWDITDPLELFDCLSSEGQRGSSDYMLPNEPLLLLAYSPPQGLACAMPAPGK
ncbi:hypothetical protein Q5H93_03620 [Hymenobacter sp. ASUV-10]|uniref:WG repeat-containing protein n=1 Tax=Hymenobacter aranciens TaxID=3063996 RepID=A0ABT9BB87_9BACT|nr:hypothetical protein [Hymenobacter sp. ASUV-10]MDO7873808.1 hypothetical protein [Hymenobacter sp. ASUV-10]